MKVSQEPLMISYIKSVRGMTTNGDFLIGC
jgi:hypothetical protein